MVEQPDSIHVERLTPAAPGRREPLELAARVMSIVMLGWCGAQSAFAWIAYDEGITSLLLPIWNSVFLLGMVPIVQGIFARRLWAQRWVVGISVFTAISNAYHATKTDSSILWIGAIVLAVVAIVVRKAKPLFNDSDGNRGRVQQTIATLVTIGSVVVSMMVMQQTGTERGREAFAAELQQSYDQAAPGAVKVIVSARELVIEAKQDSAEQIDAAADAMQEQLAQVGSRAKAWAVGFKFIIVTNGIHRRVLSSR